MVIPMSGIRRMTADCSLFSPKPLLVNAPAFDAACRTPAATEKVAEMRQIGPEKAERCRILAQRSEIVRSATEMGDPVRGGEARFGAKTEVLEPPFRGVGAKSRLSVHCLERAPAYDRAVEAVRRLSARRCGDGANFRPSWVQCWRPAGGVICLAYRPIKE